MLSVECAGRPEARSLYESALAASQGLQSGSWASVRSLAWLVRAERALAGHAEGRSHHPEPGPARIRPNRRAPSRR